MSERVTIRLDDERLQAALDEAEEEHGSQSEAVREALRRAYVEDDSTTMSVDGDGGLPKAAREGYAALREHANVGERLSLDAAESIIAQRVQLRKDTVRGSVIRKLHGAGWVAVEQGIHEVAIIVGDRAASDGGRDVGILDDRGDDVDEDEADARLDELAEATVDRGDGIETDGGREPDVVLESAREDDVELVLAFRHAGALSTLATAESGRIELYRDDDVDRGDGVETDGGRDYALPSDAVWSGYRDSEIGVGDVVVDLSRGVALQVMSVATKRAGEHPNVRSDRTAEMFDTDEDDLVFNCVFLPDGDDAVSPPRKTYAYPESRLLRFPTEEATGNARLQREWLTNVLEELAVAAAATGEESAFFDVVAEAYGDDVAELVEEFAAAAGGESA